MVFEESRRALGLQIPASDSNAGAQDVGGQSLGAQSQLPISELGFKILASDPNAEAQGVGAQSLGAQSSGHRFRSWVYRYSLENI